MMDLKYKYIDAASEEERGQPKTPVKSTPKAAGYDLFASKPCVVPSKGKALVSTGLIMEIPDGTYGRIGKNRSNLAPRSGLAAKNFIDVGAGVIDSDYRGEIKVLLFNFGDVDFEVKAGDRIAQMVIEMVAPTKLVKMDSAANSLSSTERGEKGFGSTGVN